MTDNQIKEIFLARIRLAELGSEFDCVGFARDIIRIVHMEDAYISMGKVAMRFIDRANDVSEQDQAARILSEWAAETGKVLDECGKSIQASAGK